MCPLGRVSTVLPITHCACSQTTLLLALPSALPHSWDCPFSHGSADSRPRCFSGSVLAKLQVQNRSSLVPDLLWELWSKPRPCSPLGVRPQSRLLLVWDAPQHESTGNALRCPTAAVLTKTNSPWELAQISGPPPRVGSLPAQCCWQQSGVHCEHTA